jgi:hypothetical protein
MPSWSLQGARADHVRSAPVENEVSRASCAGETAPDTRKPHALAGHDSPLLRRPTVTTRRLERAEPTIRDRSANLSGVL